MLIGTAIPTSAPRRRTPVDQAPSASGAVFLSSRPFELALVSLIYVALQGEAVFDVGVGAAATLVGHMTEPAVAWIAIAVALPRLARVST